MTDGLFYTSNLQDFLRQQIHDPQHQGHVRRHAPFLARQGLRELSAGRQLIKRSQDGECSPRAAFGAFMEAASKQDRIVRNRHRFPKEVASTLADITKFVAS